MMGNDVERILAGINNVKDETDKCIKYLSDSISYRIDIIHDESRENEVPINSSNFIKPIIDAMESFCEDYDKMESLSKRLYTNINKFNNGYGSPWTELSLLKSSISYAEEFISGHNELKWMGEKISLFVLLNTILNKSIDAKWALINYHDYIQRGYDNKFNNNEPSIKFISGINKKSTGNINHEYHENVNIKKESIDPF